MIQRLLIANRGEIALRIIRTCRRMGIQTVAVYSDADAGHPFVAAADSNIALGGMRADQSYLSIEKVIAAAAAAGADAIHPGYGFLSENAAFAERVESAGLRFVGPTPSTLRELGEKDQARKLAQLLGVPTPPGYDQKDQRIETILAAAEQIGFPLLLKAAAGGGGRGMRRIDSAAGFAEAVESAKREALSSFGDDQLILEKLVLPARHIEVQLLGDGDGDVLHFYERDCSWQRRYQKVIEEAPARGLNPRTREALILDAVKMARHAKLRSAATAEFLVSPTDGKHYFLEINPRLQVEHPVTELACGVDLVELQLRVASGEKLPLAQSDVSLRACATEARVYAEIPELGFIPSTGRIMGVTMQERTSCDGLSGVRIDHCLAPGMQISAFYDPLLAKIIGYGPTHEIARAELVGTLVRSGVLGVGTNAGFLVSLMQWSNLREIVLTSDLEQSLLDGTPTDTIAQLAEFALCWHSYVARSFYLGEQKAISAFFNGIPHDLQQTPSKFRIECANLESSIDRTATCVELRLADSRGGSPGATLTLDSREVTFRAFFSDSSSPPSAISIGDQQVAVAPILTSLDEHAFLRTSVNINGYQFAVSEIPEWQKAQESTGSSESELRAPLPGIVVSVAVVPGATVHRGDVLVVIESMKMEHSVRTPRDAAVDVVLVQVGDSVQRGTELVKLFPVSLPPEQTISS